MSDILALKALVEEFNLGEICLKVTPSDTLVIEIVSFEDFSNASTCYHIGDRTPFSIPWDEIQYIPGEAVAGFGPVLKHITKFLQENK